jgi:hypothetical protein
VRIDVNKSRILPVGFYGCETRFFTLREQQRLRVSENRLSRRIFVSKRSEMTDGWRKLHNQVVHNTQNIISRIS